MWILFAFGSAVFASLTSILGKIGIQDVNSNLGTAIRTDSYCCRNVRFADITVIKRKKEKLSGKV